MDVSVIIPVYNTEKYLSACIDSILNQANVSFEIILVDDGSTDSSAKICDIYAKEHDNIRVVHIQNSGQAVAKNEGLKLAHGNYIALTDSDDKMEPTMLHKMVSAGYELNADIICCNYKQIDEKGNISHLNCTYQQYVLNHEEGLIHFYSRDKIFSQCWNIMSKMSRYVMMKTSYLTSKPSKPQEQRSSSMNHYMIILIVKILSLMAIGILKITLINILTIGLNEYKLPKTLLKMSHVL